MAAIDQPETNHPHSLTGELIPAPSRLGRRQIFGISIFWFALNFHWFALNTIILPSQVLKLAGDAQKVSALATVLVPGAFISLVANPLFGWLSDRTSGRLAIWGRRRPYIFCGTLLNIGALFWMASAPNILSLTLACALAQFASNAAQAPFHALLPDVVPQEQRGFVSGIMGMLMITGQIGGAIVAGFLINANQPAVLYYHSLWLMYLIIIVILALLMLVTIFSAHESQPSAAEHIDKTQSSSSFALSRSFLLILGSSLLAIGVAWGLLFLWNMLHSSTLQISPDLQEVILMLILTLGVLRLFGFSPRSNPDFAWVLMTRFLMMLGITTIQFFLLYYLRDVVGASDPEQETARFTTLAAITSLPSALLAGWLSDHFGRKRVIYASGGMMFFLGIVLIVSQAIYPSLLIMYIIGAIFGASFGAYQSVDWALVADVLPSRLNFARDMGVWNVALSLPQVLVPVLGALLLAPFAAPGYSFLGYQLLFSVSALCCLAGTLTVRFIRQSR